jgi:hypothetical protein
MGDWRYGGEAVVTSEGKIQLPERLFHKGILHEERRAYWSFVRKDGFVLISDQPLEQSQYKGQGSASIGPQNEGYLTNIPKIFFDDYTGRGRGDDKEPVPEHAQVKYGELRFFAFREPMASDDREKNSCYMFDWDEFDNTIGDDDWADPLDDIPKFG